MVRTPPELVSSMLTKRKSFYQYYLFFLQLTALTIISLAAVLTSRFILDLRGVFHKPVSTHQVSTIRFVSSLAGNMGAPLEVEESTWFTGAVDDVTSDRANQAHEEAEEPFLVGLYPDENTSSSETRTRVTA